MDGVISRIGVEPVKVSQSLLSKPIAAVISPPVEDQARKSEAAESVNNTRELTEKIQANLDRMNISLKFSTYGKNGEKISVTVFDKQTGEVIRKIPPEEFQRLHEKMQEVIGLIFNGKA